MTKASRLRSLINGRHAASWAGAYDGLTAKISEEAGFDLIIGSGFQIAASYGLPDFELHSLSENLAAHRRIVSSTNLPVIADIDTGYGNAVNVVRTIREFEQLGVAGVQLEDQRAPKRCPALVEPEVIPLEEAVGKIRAAVHARANPDLVIIGRTDTLDMDDACRRARAYSKAGADMILAINKCVKNYDDLKRLREAAGVPLMIHRNGWMETLTQEQIDSVAGIAGWAFPTLMTVVASLRTNLAALRSSGTSAGLPLPVASLDDFKRLIGYEEVEKLSREFILNG